MLLHSAMTDDNPFERYDIGIALGRTIYPAEVTIPVDAVLDNMATLEPYMKGSQERTFPALAPYDIPSTFDWEGALSEYFLSAAKQPTSLHVDKVTDIALDESNKLLTIDCLCYDPVDFLEISD